MQQCWYAVDRLGIIQAGYSKIERNESRIRFEKLEENTIIFEMELGRIINFGSIFNFKNTLQNTENISDRRGFRSAENLYRDKIVLLEKLLDKPAGSLQIIRIDLDVCKRYFGLFFKEPS